MHELFPKELENKVLFGIIAGYILIQFAFFPSMYLSIDEHEYLKNSALLMQGKIAVQDPAYACRSNLYTRDGYVSSYFVGKSLFLIPFLFFGFAGAMLSGLVIHLLNLLVIALILKKLGQSPLFSLLYLFYPAFLWSSRTLFPELLVLTGFLAGIYFFLSEKKDDWILSGLFFSLSVMVRYDSIFGLVAFVLPSFFSNRGKFFRMLAGAVPAGIFIMIFNSIAYGGALSTGYGQGSNLLRSMLKGIIDIDHIYYLAILLIAYPLLLASPYIAKTFPMKKEFALASVFFFVLNSSFTNFTAFEFSIESTFIARLRYLIPLIGILIIPYSVMFSQVLSKAKPHISKKTLFAISLLLLVAAGFMSYQHSILLESRSTLLEKIYSNTPDGSTIIGSSDDCIYFQPSVFGDRKYFNIDLNQDLAGNPHGLGIQSLLSDNTYFIRVLYDNQQDRNSPRQHIINTERKKLADFVYDNNTSLVKVYGSPNLEIYRWTGNK